MRTGLSLWLIDGTLMVALPQGADAQSTAFDGTYIGVSATCNGAMAGSGRGCPNLAAPRPISIAGGQAQLQWSESTLQGDVRSQGTLTLRAPTTGRLDAQIDRQGKITRSYSGHCNYSLVRQRGR
jgi:hypothetical protein